MKEIPVTPPPTVATPGQDVRDAHGNSVPQRPGAPPALHDLVNRLVAKVQEHLAARPPRR